MPTPCKHKAPTTVAARLSEWESLDGAKATDGPRASPITRLQHGIGEEGGAFIASLPIELRAVAAWLAEKEELALLKVSL